MFRHYLLTVARNLARSKLVTLMHVAGLAVGLACFIVTFVLIQELRTGDTGFRDAGRIYAITQELWMGRAVAPVAPASPGVTMAAAPFLKTDFPQLEAVARIARAGLFGSGRTAVSAGDRHLFLYQAQVDPDFFRIFDLPFLAGDPVSALAAPDGAVITAAAARRLFGTTEVLGRRMLVANAFGAPGSTTPLTIKGVIAGVPQPSHLGDSDRSVLRFDYLTRFVPQAMGAVATDWDSPDCFTYVLLPANGSLTPAEIRAALKGFGARHMPSAQGHSVFDAIPVSTIRLELFDSAFASAGLPVTTSLAFLDALLLLVACFNYANLATAMALRRSRDVALRKIVGATRGQLLLQSLVEAAAVGVLALVLAFILMLAAKPLLDALLPLDLDFGQLRRPGVWLFLAGLLPATTLLAGAYPALVLSRLRPAGTLRAGSGRAGSRWAFKALVAVQFAAAGFLIVMALVVRDQNRTMSEALPALLRNPTVVITTSIIGSTVTEDTLRSELERSPYIRSVSSIDNEPWGPACCWLWNLARSPDASQRQIQTSANRVGSDFFGTMGIKLLAGRGLSRAQGDEIAVNQSPFGRLLNIVIDRSLAERLGWPNPADAVGKTVYRPALWGGAPGLVRVVGVVENGAPRLTGVESTNSNLYLLMPALAGLPIIRIDPRHVQVAVRQIESVWHELAPTLPLEWRFMDQLFGDAYETYSMVSALATGLTAFAFAIALIGLAGMAVHVTTSRLREVGVRKTLGATPRQIVGLLLLDFAVPVAVANVLAWPFAFLAARAYLSMFVARAHLSPSAFIASLVATVAIACLAVGGQALRAARIEPAAVLRDQ